MAKNKGAVAMIAGLVVLVLVVGVAIVYSIFNNKEKNKIELKGYVGGEKINFLEDQEVVDILNKDFGITLDIRRAGSLDMVRADDLAEKDYIWPSSQTALELYEDLHGKAPKNSIIFNTPIVLYSRSYIAEGLVAAGLATKDNDVYTVDMPALVEAMKENKQWSDIGLDRLYGSISVHTTDPAKSNSGNMFSGLVANMLNNNQVLGANQYPTVKEDLMSIFSKIGYMETSSSTLFSLFLETGMGNKPIVAGYENQLLEFSTMQPEDWPNVKQDIVIMYPAPTVWSSHVFLALNANGERLMTALQDERLQKIAWEKHGFRSGVYSAISQQNNFDVPGVAEEITRIIQMPNHKAMSEIIAAFE